MKTPGKIIRVSRTLVTKNSAGFHANSSALFISTANSYTADIIVEASGMKVNGKSIMGLLMLGLNRAGAKFTVHAVGPDAEKAVKALVKLANRGFGETD